MGKLLAHVRGQMLFLTLFVHCGWVTAHTANSHALTCLQNNKIIALIGRIWKASPTTTCCSTTSPFPASRARQLFWSSCTRERAPTTASTARSSASAWRSSSPRQGCTRSGQWCASWRPCWGSWWTVLPPPSPPSLSGASRWVVLSWPLHHHHPCQYSLPPPSPPLSVQSAPSITTTLVSTVCPLHHHHSCQYSLPPPSPPPLSVQSAPSITTTLVSTVCPSCAHHVGILITCYGLAAWVVMRIYFLKAHVCFVFSPPSN